MTIRRYKCISCEKVGFHEGEVKYSECPRCHLAVYKPVSTLLFIVGPDMCGKTEIGKALSHMTGLPYFKASTEHASFLTDQSRFLKQLIYADPRVLDFIKQTRASVIFDRGYPCEYAYSHVEGRETDHDTILKLDHEYAKLDAVIIFCYRSSYAGVIDDLDARLQGNILQKIHDEYEKFMTLSKCRWLKLNVDDEDLARETEEIVTYLKSI